MECGYKHTKYNPTDEEFLCPKCGSSEFFIDEGPGVDALSGVACELLHDEDVICCYDCGHTISGKKFANMVLKKEKLIKCPHCKGKGYIKEKIDGDSD